MITTKERNSGIQGHGKTRKWRTVRYNRVRYKTKFNGIEYSDHDYSSSSSFSKFSDDCMSFDNATTASDIDDDDD